MSDRVVMWDFDGTLAWRPGFWGGCVMEVLDEHAPGHAVSLEAVREGMKGRFPWNNHARAHPELGQPEAWWTAMGGAIAEAIAGCGIDPGRARTLSAAVRARFVDPSCRWEVFPDSASALEVTAEAGWRNVILSNHVPELEAIVAALGLATHVERVFSSALIGYEKPHPEAFRHALRESGNPAERWMVGDNPLADLEGAQALGIPAILIRSARPSPHSARDAAAAAALIAAH